MIDSDLCVFSTDMPFGPGIFVLADLAEVEITPHNGVRLNAQSVTDGYEFLDCQIGSTALYGTIVGTVDICCLRQRDLRKASAVSGSSENNPDFAGHVIFFDCLGDDGLLIVGVVRLHAEILLFLGLRVLLCAETRYQYLCI